MIQRMYDPPAGWRYGFPKPFNPEPGSTIEETLLKDGYPQREIDNAGAEYCRFWDAEVAEFCLHCGAGQGSYRREGEGICPECEPCET